MKSIIHLAIGLSVAYGMIQSVPATDNARSQEADIAVEIPERFRNAMFKTDSFTFVRIKFQSIGGRRGPAARGRWATDYPDADINLSRHLKQFSTLDVKVDGLVMELTDEGLEDHPFIYMAEPGSLSLSDDEVDALRRYLNRGGFLMVDDFWGELEWNNFNRELRRVFPEREPVELALEHPIFHSVFDLEEKPQVCSIHAALAGREEGVDHERPDGVDPRYMGIFNDDERLMVIICHNNDLADGWERSNADAWYFREFSQKRAYPMATNIVYYALSH